MDGWEVGYVSMGTDVNGWVGGHVWMFKRKS